MNRMSCNVIQDLMPLYIEDMCSTESRELVEAHIAECEKCRQLFYDYTDDTIVKEVRQPEKEEEPAFEQILKKVENKVMKRVTVIAAVVMSFVIAIGIINFAPVLPVSYENAIVKVTVSEEKDRIAIDTALVRIHEDEAENTIVLTGRCSLAAKHNYEKSGQTYHYSESWENGKISKVIYQDADGTETVLWEK